MEKVNSTEVIKAERYVVSLFQLSVSILTSGKSILIDTLRIPRIFREGQFTLIVNVHITHLSCTVPTLTTNVLESRLTLRIHIL